jgi:hypothetical protein
MGMKTFSIVTIESGFIGYEISEGGAQIECFI